MLVVSVISTLYGPLILIAFSRGEHNKLKELTMDNSLIIGIITAIITGALIGFSKPIIGYWMGFEYSSYNFWLILKSASLPFYAAAGVYALVFRSWNRVKIPAIITLCVGIINIILSFIICKVSEGNEMYINYLICMSTILIIFQSFGLNSYVFYKIYPDIKYINNIYIFF